MKNSKFGFVSAAIVALGVMAMPVGAAQAPPEPAAPNTLAGGIPREFTMISPDGPSGPACVYYNEVSAGRGDAVDQSTCISEQSHIFTRLTQPDSYIRIELTDHYATCLIGDTSTNPGVLVVGSCDDPRADWGGGGSVNPAHWVLYPRSNPKMYLRDNGIALVLQNTADPLHTPGYYWRLM